jgi:hypothetical protein
MSLTQLSINTAHEKQNFTVVRARSSSWLHQGTEFGMRKRPGKECLSAAPKLHA